MNGGQIESRESVGLLNGMRNMITTMDKVRMTPRKNGRSVALGSEVHSKSLASRVIPRLPMIASTPNGTMFGRSIVTSKVATT